MDMNGEIKKFCLKGDIPGLITWLEKNDEAGEIYRKYQARFIMNDKETLVSENEKLDSILQCYANYYKAVFYDKIANKLAIIRLSKELSKTIGIKGGIGKCEKKAKSLFEEAGYHFLGGTTSSFYGPYIWKNTETKEYEVMIPEGEVKLPVLFMHEWLSNSWLDYISFGVTGTGGWAKKDGLYCNNNIYAPLLETDRFRISFLKHESQHHKDYENKKWFFSVPVLEYRAKLCELCYLQDPKTFQGFINGAVNDKHFSHGIAEYWLVSDLSKAIFDEDYVTDFSRWSESYKKVAPIAKNLLLTYNRGKKRNLWNTLFGR